jgi:hypothetical protein
MRKRLMAFVGLKVVTFGIWIYELNPLGMLDEADKDNLKKLWKYHDEFQANLK